MASDRHQFETSAAQIAHYSRGLRHAAHHAEPREARLVLAAHDMGLKVGTQFAIAGFDDAPLVQYLNPPLTSVRQPIWEVGQRIIPMLLEYIERGQPPEPPCLLVDPQLIVRGSTGGKNNGNV